MDEVLALLLHSGNQVFGLFLHCTDCFLHFVHLVLESELVLFNEADVQFLSSVAPLQVSANVDVIISNNTSDQIRRGDALRSLSRHKHSCFLDVLINIV